MPAIVDVERCNGCLRCESACPAHAVSVMDCIAVIAADECTDCGRCNEVCPNGAIHASLAPTEVELDVDAGLVFKIYGRVVADPHAPLYRRGLLLQPSAPNIRFEEPGAFRTALGWIVRARLHMH